MNSNFNIDKIKQQVNIVDLISRDEQLHKEGNEWGGAHSAKHTSKGKRCLFVNEQKQVFNCFDCGAGGDIFDYVMDRDNCNPIEAVNRLCETFNIKRPDWTPEQKAKYEA